MKSDRGRVNNISFLHISAANLSLLMHTGREERERTRRGMEEGCYQLEQEAFPGSACLELIQAELIVKLSERSYSLQNSKSTSNSG